MSGSLKDELLRLGLAKPRPEEPKQRRRDARAPRPGERSPRTQGEQAARRTRDAHPDGSSQQQAGRAADAHAAPAASQPAWHGRAHAAVSPSTTKRSERVDARARDREREARLARLRERIEAHKLDDAQAEIKQYYSTGKKIKRIYVTEAQAAALLRGEIVIVVAQGKGRLVPSAVLPELREIDPELRVVDPGAAPAVSEDGVPDDLRW